MKISLLQENLHQALGFLQKAIPSKPSLPILSSVLVEASEKSCSFSATDLYFGVTVSVPATVAEPGTCVIPGKQLKEIVQTLNAGEIKLEQTETSCKILSPSTTSSLPVQLSDDFPPFPQVEGDTYSFPRELLSHIKQTIIKSASTDPTRPILTGILFELDETSLKVVATDGFRLSLFQTTSSDQTPGKLLIPAKVVEEVARVAEVLELDTVACSVSQELQQVAFSLGSVKMVSRLIEGEYPPYEKIIPASSLSHLEIDSDELQEQIMRAQIFSKDFSSVVQLVYDQEKVVVKSSSSTSGSFEGDVTSASISGEDGTIAFNAKYLLDFLQMTKEARISLELSGDQKPALITSPQLPNFSYIVMPFKINS